MSTQKTLKFCEKCGGQNVKTHQITYPIEIGDKTINVARVSVKECIDCHVLTPTKAGKAKIERCRMMSAMLFLYRD